MLGGDSKESTTLKVGLSAKAWCFLVFPAQDYGRFSYKSRLKPDKFESHLHSFKGVVLGLCQAAAIEVSSEPYPQDSTGRLDYGEGLHERLRCATVSSEASVYKLARSLFIDPYVP